MSSSTQTTHKTLSIVIPCNDEEEAIPIVLDRIESHRQALVAAGIQLCQVIVIDDGSIDRSAELLRQRQDVLVLRNEERKGYGFALQQGFARAEGEYIAFFDMDNTYPVEAIPRLFKVMQEKNVDLICGDRLSQLSGMPWSRKLGNLLFVSTIHLLFRRPIVDSCTGMRLFHRRFVDDFQNIQIPHLGFSLAMTLSCLARKIPFVEEPIAYGRRTGHSKLRISLDGPRFLFTILRSWINLRLGLRSAENLFVSSHTTSKDLLGAHQNFGMGLRNSTSEDSLEVKKEWRS